MGSHKNPIPMDKPVNCKAQHLQILYTLSTVRYYLNVMLSEQSTID